MTRQKTGLAGRTPPEWRIFFEYFSGLTRLTLRLIINPLNEPNQMTIRMPQLASALPAILCAFTLNTFAEDAKLPPAAAKTDVTYASDTKAIFDASCVKCHSGDRPKARLRMDTLAGVLKGTKEGPIVIAGDSAKSLIVQSIAHATRDKDSWMPPLNNPVGIKPLTVEQIGLIRAWIDQGAK